MPDGLPLPHRFSADEFSGFTPVFRYNARYTGNGKTMTAGPDGRQLTYGTADALTARLCGWFAQQGLKRGDRAVILSHDDLAVVTLFLACARSRIPRPCCIGKCRCGTSSPGGHCTAFT